MAIALAAENRTSGSARDENEGIATGASVELNTVQIIYRYNLNVVKFEETQ
jgi:hypothetical protein